MDIMFFDLVKQYSGTSNEKEGENMHTKTKNNQPVYEELELLATMDDPAEAEIKVFVRLMRHTKNGNLYIDIRKVRQKQGGKPFYLRSGVAFPIEEMPTMSETFNLIAAALS